MPPKHTRLGQKPSILDCPSFQAPDVDLIRYPNARKPAAAAEVDDFSRRSNHTITRAAPPSHQQSRHNEKIIQHNPPAKTNRRPAVTKIRNLPTTPLTTNSHEISRSRHQEPTVFLTTPNLRARSDIPDCEALNYPTQASQNHRRPLSPSKIHHLKTAYEPFQTPTGIEHSTSQPRLSRAIKFHLTHLNTKANQFLLSELSFSDEKDVQDAQTSWITHRKLRDARVRRVDPVSPLDLHFKSNVHARIIGTNGYRTPTLLRHGPKNSNIPILVRWTDPSGPDSYALYHEREPMPREVRFLLFEATGWPLGREGEEWDVDADARVWIRERGGLASWGRCWRLM